ncbi:hypothetical protein D7B24_008280 [Verticillium nonalfalfae]|uniref:Uncharacterized protein n=1 Tax=Verticillium nonalfalfae TaxID=1051616 RepID=A0A3M9Y818_9PEZI|nr:uncharacterized protein D7B24_008280 [Verticillium nonalfalfae]RNJ55658.1 hypothetical protein D7B24_008280 [Verticillium nonalfalfae]
MKVIGAAKPRPAVACYLYSDICVAGLMERFENGVINLAGRTKASLQNVLHQRNGAWPTSTP